MTHLKGSVSSEGSKAGGPLSPDEGIGSSVGTSLGGHTSSTSDSKRSDSLDIAEAVTSNQRASGSLSDVNEVCDDYRLSMRLPMIINEVIVNEVCDDCQYVMVIISIFPSSSYSTKYFLKNPTYFCCFFITWLQQIYKNRVVKYSYVEF